MENPPADVPRFTSCCGSRVLQRRVHARVFPPSTLQLPYFRKKVAVNYLTAPNIKGFNSRFLERIIVLSILTTAVRVAMG